MKRINCYVFIAVILEVLILAGGCTKDLGYHNYVRPENKFNGSTYEYLQSKKGVFDSLLYVIDRTGFADTLKKSAITLFAVTNESFQSAITVLNGFRGKSGKPPLYLSTVSLDQLDTLMSMYVMDGEIPSDSLALGDGRFMYGIKFGEMMHAQQLTSTASGYDEGGMKYIEFADTKGSNISANWVTTRTSGINLKTANGFVHILNSDHVFGFDELVPRLSFTPLPPNLFLTVGGKLSPSRDDGFWTQPFVNSYDGNAYTSFLLFDVTPTNVWMQFEPNEPTVAIVYTLTSATDGQVRDPAAWIFAGSMDGENWTTLDSRWDQVFETRVELRAYYFHNTTAYKFYRLTILSLFSNWLSGNTFQIAEWTING